jgi:hypothetical protein
MSKQKRRRRRFTAEFKAETVKLVKQSDRTMADIAMELGISAKSIGECRRLGPAGMVLLHPLMGGTPPELAWESLRLIEPEVLPAVRG